MLLNYNLILFSAEALLLDAALSLWWKGRLESTGQVS